MLTSSFACTSSPASVAITSFAFMFEEVPEPVWKTSIGNWSSSSPAAIRSPAAAIRSALSGSSRPSSALTRAAAALIRPSQRATGAGIGSPETGKLPIAFVVSPPQSSSLRDLATLVSGADDAPKQPAHPRRVTPSTRSVRRRGVEQLVPGAELDARPAVRLAARALELVDRRPAVVSTNGRAALGEQLRRGRRSPRAAAGRRAASSSSSDDGLGRVLLVRPDHAARAALDPARAVDARDRRSVRRRGRGRRRSGSCRGPRRTGTSGERDAAVADAAEDEAARDRLALVRRDRRDRCRARRRRAGCGRARPPRPGRRRGSRPVRRRKRSTQPLRLALRRRGRRTRAAGRGCAARSLSRRRARPRSPASSSRSAGSTITSAPASSPSSSSSGFVNAACAGPRRPRATISRDAASR